MTDTADQPQHLLIDDFFTDAHLAPFAATPSGRRCAIPASDASAKPRYFCGGNEPTMLYQLPGPLSWDE